MPFCAEEFEMNRSIRFIAQAMRPLTGCPKALIVVVVCVLYIGPMLDD